MEMNWKFTVVGGAENGMDAVLPGDAPVLVGRTHEAALHISEPDVSGRHLEFFCAKGVCQVRNLSRYASRLNGRELTTGAVSPVAVGDAIEIGRQVRIRIDGIPVELPAREKAPTSWMEGGFSDVPTAVLEESTVISRGGGIPTGRAAPVTSATRPLDGVTMETGLMSPSDSSHADGDTQTGAANEDGETGELVTRICSPEELEERRNTIERKRRFRKIGVLFVLALIALFLTALWFLSRSGAETNSMEYPKIGGVKDSATYILRDDDGRALVEVDYPRNPNASVTVSPSSNGISVVSYMGRDRDVPFYLKLETVRREEELRIGLVQSVRAWLKRMEESSSGFVFDMRAKEELVFRFFEDTFPGCCQVQSLYGIKFVTLEYKRTWPDGTPWHGVLIYFRNGDTAFVHRREIPEEYWVRGSRRIRQDPNIAIYANLINSYWESPGVDGLPLDRPASELLGRIRDVLSKDRASDWPFLKKDLDVVLIKSWRGDSRARKLAEECLRQFRDVLKTYYYGKFNAFQNARYNRDVKRMRKIRRDCEMVFDDRNERYYFLVGNSEVW